MSDMRIQIELRFSPAMLKWGVAVLVLTLCAPELGSENVTLTTYYPAPSGVYAQMLTTGNTYLARDGGKVGIGLTNPTHQVDLTGDIRAAKHVVGIGVTTPATAYLTASAASATDSLGFFTASAERITVNSAGYVGIGATNPGAIATGGNGTGEPLALDVNGIIRTRFNSSDAGEAPCVEMPVSGPTTVCGGANTYYATLISGIYSSHSIMPTVVGNSLGEQVVFFCCPCPAGGCP